ncbi:hypothetical protein HYS48_02285 [Candidatus Woesearchaeota archaeon]|nr:hypothetical protein [Candidatus Woesearchaeota archaeon]
MAGKARVLRTVSGKDAPARITAQRAEGPSIELFNPLDLVLNPGAMVEFEERGGQLVVTKVEERKKGQSRILGK